MDDENPRVALGDNRPPEPTPFEAMQSHILDLSETAQGFLDGEPIANQETADLIGKLIADARTARNDAEALRKEEAKPFDDGKKAVQAKWTPLTDEKVGKCALVIATAKKALAPWLQKLDDEQRAAADLARKRADEARQKALESERAAQADNLAAQEIVAQARKDADIAQRAANKADKAKPQATGGSRAIGLRSTWTAEVTDPLAFGKWLWLNRRDEYLEFINGQAASMTSLRPTVPGVLYHESRVAA